MKDFYIFFLKKQKNHMVFQEKVTLSIQIIDRSIIYFLYFSHIMFLEVSIIKKILLTNS